MDRKLDFKSGFFKKLFFFSAWKIFFPAKEKIKIRRTEELKGFRTTEASNTLNFESVRVAKIHWSSVNIAPLNSVNIAIFFMNFN